MDSLISRLVAAQERKAIPSKVKPKSSQSLRASILSLLESENAKVGVERQISVKSAFTVASRSLNKTASLSNETRFFSAYREVASFLSLAHNGEHINGKNDHTDLLPVGHPLSSRSHFMTNFSMREAQARWIAADPRVHDSVKELVASAYSQPLYSVERLHAFSRVQALTAGLLPQELRLDASVSALIAAGNDSASRSLRARMQRRDRKGRFANEGGGLQFFLRMLDGAIHSVVGKFAGNSSNSGDYTIELHGVPGVPDGLYDIPTSKTEAIKAVLPSGSTSDHNLNVQLPSGVEAENFSDLKPKASPDGWDLVSDNTGQNLGPDKVFKSDDNYQVEVYNVGNKSASKGLSYAFSSQNKYSPDPALKGSKPLTKNVDGAVVTGAPAGPKLNGKSPTYIISRLNPANGKPDAAIGIAQTWADIQDMADKDQDNFDKALPDYQSAHDSAQAHIKNLDEQQKAAAEKKKAQYENNEKVIAHINENHAANKDVNGNDLPEGWSGASKNILYGKQYANLEKEKHDYAEYTKRISDTPHYDVTAKLNADGSIDFNGNTYKSWDDVEAAIPDAYNQEMLRRRESAKKTLAAYADKYDFNNDDIAKLIDSGATQDEVIKYLDDNYPKYAADHESYANNGPMPDFPSKEEKAQEARLYAISAATYKLMPENKETPAEKQAPIATLLEKPVEEPTANTEKSFTDWTVPNNAYKLQTKYEYEPQGRVDEDSSDFTDDPKVLANKFTQDELAGALTEALIGKKDFAAMFKQELDNIGEDTEEDTGKKSKPGPKPKPVEIKNVASGAGALDFKAGEEYVPAEAIYEALKDKGVDADHLVAEIYDSALGENKNVSALEGDNKQEHISAQSPSVLFDDLSVDKGILELHSQLAAPSVASYTVSMMNDLKDAGDEQNKSLVSVGDSLKAINEAGNYEGYKSLLIDHIEKAFSDNPDDQQAFRGMWGLLTSLDGGTSDYEAGDSELAYAVDAAIRKHNGTSSDQEVIDFVNKWGTFEEFVASKLYVAQGKEDINSPDSLAGSFFKLMNYVGSDNKNTLYRGIELDADSEALNDYITQGGVVSIDPRSFTDDKATSYSHARTYNADKDKASVVFQVKPGQATSFDASNTSMYEDEREHLVWGDFTVTSVKTTEEKNGKTIYGVTLEKLSPRDAVLNGYNDNADKFLTENKAVDLPEGYHVPDPDKYTPTQAEDSVAPDDPLYIARSYESADLADVFRAGIEDGTGTAQLEYDADHTASVPVEAIRDALQIQGVDTNQILDDIANAGPGAHATEDTTPPVAENLSDSPVTHLANEISAEYDLTPYKKIGGQKGSNEGGTYEDPEGNQAYIKTPKDELHAQNEVLASALYRALDVPAAEMYMGSGEDGKLKVYSPLVPGAQENMQSKLKDPEYLAKLQDGFAVDAWLANWDVAGLAFDNVVTDENGDPVRVDPGGALLFRAMGAPKGKLFGDKVSELDTLRDSKMNPQSASIFGSMTEEQQKESARRLLNISNEEIGTLVHSVISDPETASNLTTTLEARRYNILDRYGLLPDDTSTIVDNAKIEESNTISESVSTPTPETTGGKVYTTSDGANITVGMKVKHNKTGDVGTVVKLDKGNESYVYVQGDGETKPKVKSTKQLSSVPGNGGGGEETPSAPKAPTAPEETPAPAAPETQTPEVTAPQAQTEAQVPTQGTLDNGVSYKTEEKKINVSAWKGSSGQVDGLRVTLGGNTFKNKQAIKDAGFKWNGTDKVWSKDYVELASFPSLSKKNILKDLETINGGKPAPKENVPTPEPTSTSINEVGSQGVIDTIREADIANLISGIMGNDNYYQKGGFTFFGPNQGPGQKTEGISVYKGSWEPGDKQIAEISAEGGVDWTSKEDAVANSADLQKALTPDIETPPEGIPAAPEGTMTITDASGNEVYQGIEITDKKGAKGTILKVNAENYALVQFEDGSKGWRSAKTISATGAVNNDGLPKLSKAKVSKKATGAGVAPIIVSEPSDWSKSDFENMPSLADAVSKVTDTSEKANGIKGASAVVDSDSIEDLDLRVMHVKDAEGVDGFLYKFKLTSWAANDLIAGFLKNSKEENEKNGITSEQFKILRIDVGPDGVGQINPEKAGHTSNSGLTWVVRTKDGITIRINRANKDATNKFSSNYYEKAPRAFHNTVNIQAPATATPDQIAEALSLAGVTANRPATQADIQVLIENRLMSIFDAKTDANTNPKGNLREQSLARIKDKWGITPEDVQVVPGASGRVELRLSPEGAQKIWEATGKPAAIQHNLSMYTGETPGDTYQDKEVNWLVALFSTPQGGLLSTTTRWSEGIGTNGMSSQSDIPTGGADYVFTKPVANASAKEYGVSGSAPALYFDPLKLYERLDFYANQHDAYGKRTPNKDVISAAKVGAYEVMFKHRIAWEDLDVVVMRSDIRDAVITKLTAMGITTLGGRPLDQVIVVGKKA